MSITIAHTEEEARAKWCPLSRGICIASDCMAWRFIRTHVANDATGNLIESTNTHGYCGLAGDPRIST